MPRILWRARGEGELPEKTVQRHPCIPTPPSTSRLRFQSLPRRPPSAHALTGAAKPSLWFATSMLPSPLGVNRVPPPRPPSLSTFPRLHFTLSDTFHSPQCAPPAPPPLTAPSPPRAASIVAPLPPRPTFLMATPQALPGLLSAPSAPAFSAVSWYRWGRCTARDGGSKLSGEEAGEGWHHHRLLGETSSLFTRLGT